MTEKVLAALDAITARVLSYRPKDKGLADEEIARLNSDNPGPRIINPESCFAMSDEDRADATARLSPTPGASQ